MQVIRLGTGKTVEYSIGGTKLKLSGDFEIDLSERQRDIETIIDVFIDDEGKLTEEGGTRYAANVVIPAMSYKIVEREEEINGEPVTVLEKVPEELDIDRVTLQLWPIPEENKEQNI